jgi:hypothetical protein
MATIHDLVEYANSGLQGAQSAQRDWSPYLVHLTSWDAMSGVRTAIKDCKSAKEVKGLIEEADRRSFDVVKLIAGSASLRATQAQTEEGKLDRVCLTECTLTGLLGHCERFGRFGWVFTKQSIHAAGGRPCCYVEDDLYTALSRQGKAEDAEDSWKRLWSLSNVYRPPGAGQVQDFTHEREWRVFREIDLTATAPVAVIAPTDFVDRMKQCFPSVSLCVPLDLLHRWGA